MLIEALSVSECGNFICFYLIILHIVFYSAVICSIYIYSSFVHVTCENHSWKQCHNRCTITLHDKSSYRYKAFYMWQICVCLYSYTLSHLINNGASIILSYLIFSLWFLWVCKFVVYSRLSIDRIFSHCCLRVQTSKSKWWWSTDVTKRYCESVYFDV